MNKEQVSDGLKKKIEEGFVVLDEENRTAKVGVNLDGYSRTVAGILLLIRDVMGCTAELTMRHCYTVTLDPTYQMYLSPSLWS